MKTARLTAFVLVCVLAAAVAGGAAGKSGPKHGKTKFNTRYGCSKAGPAKLVSSFLAGWEGNVVLKGKSENGTYTGGGSSGCSYVYAGGPFAGQFGGNLIIEYGSKAASAYESDEKVAKAHGAQACAQHGNPSGDPRVCGPVEIAGVGSDAYEAFFYIAALKGETFVQLQAGPGVANGQWIPSSTLPPADALENAEQAILAKLP